MVKGNLQQYELRVANLDCENEASQIRRGLERLAGIKELRVFPKSAKVMISVDETILKADAVKSALTQMGFPVLPSTSVAEAPKPWKNLKVITSVISGQYYDEYDSSEADSTDGYGSEPYNYHSYGWYPNYGLGFSYYYPSYYWSPFYSSRYYPWYFYPYRSSFYGFYHYPNYYGHGFGGGYGVRHGTRKFGHTRSGSSRPSLTSSNGYFYRLGASNGNRTTRAGNAMRRSASRNSISYSRPPSFRPSRPSYSPPRSGGGFNGGSRGSGGARGGGSRGGRR